MTPAPLDVLPTRLAGAAENMAADFLLLQRYPAAQSAHPRFRHYGWRLPAFTFGYSQKFAFVREQTAAATAGAGAPERVELCRRPTGGGIVDHREDWTYALVIPRGHPLEELRAAQSYRAVHEALAEALQSQGIAARVKPCEPGGAACEGEAPGPAGVCFTRAEAFDVVQAGSGVKIAGAAQKRNKHGLLFQGSIWRPAAGAVDWDRFEADFVGGLARMLGTGARTTGWPEIDDEELGALSEQYSSPEWNEHR